MGGLVVGGCWFGFGCELVFSWLIVVRLDRGFVSVRVATCCVVFGRERGS